MRCLIVQPIHEAGLLRLTNNGVDPLICPAPDMATVAEHIGGCQAVITGHAGLDAVALAAAKRLHVVIVNGADHGPVDKDAATRAGAIVATTPGGNAHSVAELALGLALAVARRIPAADRAVRKGGHGFRETHRFAELTGKTALIVGWGATGRQAAALYARALDMRILVHSPRSPEILEAERAPSLTGALARADLISLHTPLREETRGLIGRAALAVMRPGAILINVADAGLVEETALLAALRSGRIGGAALDAYSPGAPQGPLAELPNVIFTPQLGGNTEEAQRQMAIAAAGQVIAALEGRMPATTINPEAWRTRS
ncbi:MAG: NAD(P)-dependent oxidoreductase [Pseudorhodobacter sp.]